MSDTTPHDVHLTPSEVASRYQVTERTLEKWRAAGVGPDWIPLGRNTIRYRLSDVLAYEEARRRGAKEKDNANASS